MEEFTSSQHLAVSDKPSVTCERFPIMEMIREQVGVLLTVLAEVCCENVLTTLKENSSMSFLI